MTASPPRPNQLARLRSAQAAPTGRVAIVDVPMGNFLMVDGMGSPASDRFRRSVEAVIALSAALRLFLQDERGGLFHPMPLEILWSAPGDEAWAQALPDQWAWTAMIGQPAGVTPALLTVVREQLAGRDDPGAPRALRLGSLREGLCAQTAEPGAMSGGTAAMFARLRDEIRARGYEPFGPRHEIYLADPRRDNRVPLRTIVRQPIHRAA